MKVRLAVVLIDCLFFAAVVTYGAAATFWWERTMFNWLLK